MFSWIIAPAVAASLIAPKTWDVLANAPINAVFWTWFIGSLWGIGVGHIAQKIEKLGKLLEMDVVRVC